MGGNQETMEAIRPIAGRQQLLGGSPRALTLQPGGLAAALLTRRKADSHVIGSIPQQFYDIFGRLLRKKGIAKGSLASYN